MSVPRLRELIARARVRGPAETLRGGARLARRELHGLVRRRRLRRRPLSVTPSELAAALGREPVELLRGRVLAALPTVAHWEIALEDRGNVERQRLLAKADAVAAHRFDLLGSGPTDLGEIDWQQDFKTGRSWPLVHISRVPISFADGSDIKVPWELSRAQHLPLLAAAWRLTGRRGYLDEIGEQLNSWIGANPVEYGANWAIAMEPAIRSANWLATLALVAEDAAGEPWFERALGSLLLHGRFIRTHLEGGGTRGNHYLSNVSGLLVLSSLFDGAEGHAWADWAAAELASELEHQVLRDGVDHEVSTAYHRLVTELFVCGAQAARIVAAPAVTRHLDDRITQMLGFTRDVTRPDGLAPLIGDSDDGRFLPLGGYGDDPRSHVHLFEQAGQAYAPAAEPATYRDAGFYVARRGDIYILVRCGPTGVRGQGWHAHNDQLSFELCVRGTPLVIDPGTFVYTADPAERNRFRSNRSHSTLTVAGLEQNELSPVELFRLPDRSHARCLRWDPNADPIVFEGSHRGFPGITHTRRLELRPTNCLLTIVDEVEGAADDVLEWTFPIASGTATAQNDGVEASINGVRVEFAGSNVEWFVEPGLYAPRYGTLIEVPYVKARRVAPSNATVTTITLSFAP